MQTVKYEREENRMHCSGLDLNRPVDSLKPNKFTFLKNARTYQYGRVEPRLGLTKISSLGGVPDITYGFIIKNRFVAITDANTVRMTEETVAGGGVYPAWATVTVPPGPWARVSNEATLTAFYLTRPGGDTGIAVQYPHVGVVQPWTAVTVSPTAVKGKVLFWDTEAPGATHLDKFLQVGSSGFIAETTGVGIDDPYLGWTAQSALPVTTEWAVQIPDNDPFNGGGSTLIIPKTSGTYIYTNNPPGTYGTGTMLAGDWRDGAVNPLGGFTSQYMVVGATGGANVIGYLSVYNGAWVAKTPPAGYTPVDPRIICFYRGGIVNPAADATWIAIAGGACTTQIIYSEVVAGVPGAWTAMPNVPVVPNAVWTGIAWQYNKNPGNHILIVGTDGVNPLLIVSNDAFNSPPITWTQKTFLVAPF